MTARVRITVQKPCELQVRAFAIDSAGKPVQGEVGIEFEGCQEGSAEFTIHANQSVWVGEGELPAAVSVELAVAQARIAELESQLAKASAKRSGK